MYFYIFVIFKENNWAKLLVIAKFAWKNIKNANIDLYTFWIKKQLVFLFFKKKNLILDLNPN